MFTHYIRVIILFYEPVLILVPCHFFAGRDEIKLFLSNVDFISKYPIFLGLKPILFRFVSQLL